MGFANNGCHICYHNRNWWCRALVLASLFIFVSKVKCGTSTESTTVTVTVPSTSTSTSSVFGANTTDSILHKRPPNFKTRQCIESDLFCRTPDLLEKKGYPVETHKVITEDGFVLVAHRIPYGNLERSAATRKKVKSYVRRPVILAHALLCSSSDWLMNLPEKALGYQLADAGFDVWLLNSRGNSYSSEHVKYTDSMSEYWDFSFHEMGIYDVPAWVDYILNVTGHKDLYYIGHSMGTTQFFIGMSERPEYNQKIRKMFALAPALYLTNSRYWLFSRLAPIYGTFIDYFGASRFFPETFRSWLNILGYGCTAVEPICDNFFFFVAGYNPKQTNSSQTAIIASHTPDNVSSKTINHFLQIMKSDKFQKYDYGLASNLVKYNSQAKPPEYDLTRVTAPVYYFHSENDVFATANDTLRSANLLPNLMERNVVKDELFTHVDFTYAKDADKLVYQRILEILIDDEKFQKD